MYLKNRAVFAKSDALYLASLDSIDELTVPPLVAFWELEVRATLHSRCTLGGELHAAWLGILILLDLLSLQICDQS